MTQQKRCPMCGETKGPNDFGRNKRTSDGWACHCKSCVKVKNRAQYLANRERRIAEARAHRAENRDHVCALRRARHERTKPVRAIWTAKNREKLRQQERDWRAQHPEHSREWRARNREHRLQWERDHRDTNRERYRESAREQRRANPERYRAAKRKYRASKQNNGHIPHTEEQLAAKVAYWGNRCWICRVDLTTSVINLDHVKPINKGGMDCLSNLRPACESCNKSKRDTWPFTPKELAA